MLNFKKYFVALVVIFSIFFGFVDTASAQVFGINIDFTASNYNLAAGQSTDIAWRATRPAAGCFLQQSNSLSTLGSAPSANVSIVGSQSTGVLQSTTYYRIRCTDLYRRTSAYKDITINVIPPPSRRVSAAPSASLTPSLPVVEILSPSEGSTYTIGQTMTIKWKINGTLPLGEGLAFEITKEGAPGNVWYPLKDVPIFESGERTISIPGDDSWFVGNWEIGVGPVRQDYFNQSGQRYPERSLIYDRLNFIISESASVSPAPSVQSFISPTSGQVFNWGDTVNVRWSNPLPSSAILEMFKSDGTSMSSNDKPADSTSHPFSIPSDQPYMNKDTLGEKGLLSGQFYFVLKTLSGAQIARSANFSIVPKPYIKFTNDPSLLSSYTNPSRIDFSWETAGLLDARFNVIVSKIVNGISTTVSARVWEVPAGTMPYDKFQFLSFFDTPSSVTAGTYKITIKQNVASPVISPVESPTFTIIRNTPPVPTLTITDKGNSNTGNWTIGQPITVRWSGANLLGPVTVSLKKSNTILADGICKIGQGATGVNAINFTIDGAGDCTSISGSGFSGNIVPVGTYTLVLQSGDTKAEAVPINVLAAPVPPTINSFTADSAAVLKGGSTTLRWNVTGADKCYLLKDSAGSSAGNIGLETTISGPQTTGAIDRPIEFKLTCYKGDLPASRTLPISLAAPIIDSFTADSASVIVGQPTTLRWSIRGAESCIIDSASVNAVSGTKSTGNLTAAKTFVLSCVSGSNPPVTRSVSVEVVQPTVSVSVPASPSAGYMPGTNLSVSVTTTNVPFSPNFNNSIGFEFRNASGLALFPDFPLIAFPLNSASQTFQVPLPNFPSPIAPGRYTLRASVAGGASPSGLSNDFLVGQPSISVTVPSGTYYPGSPMTFTWRGTGLPANSRIEFRLDRGGGSSPIGPSSLIVANPNILNSQPITLPADIQPGDDYEIRVIGPNGVVGSAPLTVANPTIAVTVPTSGTYYSGSSMTFTWRGTGLPANSTVRFYLKKGNSLESIGTSDVVANPNVNIQKTITLPPNAPAGNDYKIVVEKVEGSPVLPGESNSFFIITPSLNLVVANPTNIATGHISGGQLKLNWSAPGVSGNVDVMLIEKSTGVAKKIVSNVPVSAGLPVSGAPSYIFDIPSDLASGQYLVRVSKVSGPDDEKEITITKPEIKNVQVSTATGAPHIPGGPVAVDWQTYGISGNVKIELIHPTTLASVATIKDSTPHSPSFYSGNIPMTVVAGNYKVKVSQGPTVFGISDQTITVVAPAIKDVTVPAEPAPGYVSGGQLKIKWNTVAISGTVKIELTRAGATPILLAAAAPFGAGASTQPYTVTIPASVATGDYRVKVSQGTTGPFDETDTTFKITKQSLSVTTDTLPVPGHISGGPLTVNWVAEGITGNVKIELLNSAGTVVSTLSSSRPISPASFPATIPNTVVSGLYKVKVTPLSYISLAQPSPAFTITQQNLTVTTNTLPAPGHISGGPLTVNWVAEGITSNVKIELLNSSDTVVSTLSSSRPISPGSFPATIPVATATGDYKVRVTPLLYPERAKNSVAFRITSPSITVDSPVLNQTYNQGDSVRIQFTPTAITGNVKIVLVPSSGPEIIVRSSVTAGASTQQQTYDFPIQANVAAGNYRAKVIPLTPALAGFTAVGANFRINAVTLTIQSPAANQTFNQGATLPVRWTPTNVTGNVKIELVPATGAATTIYASIPAGASGVPQERSYVIPPTFAHGTYKLRITTLTNPLPLNPETGSFRILPVSVTLISPNGGETFNGGQAIPIRWSSENAGNRIRIRLIRADGVVVHSSVQSNTGSYSLANITTWPLNVDECDLANQTTNTSNFKVEVSIPDTEVSDSSNNNFTVKPSPTFLFYSPVEGEFYKGGVEKVPLRWVNCHPRDWFLSRTVNSLDQAKLDIINSNGTVVRTINTDNDGSYNLELSGAGTFRARLTLVQHPEAVGVSSRFVLSNTAIPLSVSAPRATERYDIGANIGVTWNRDAAGMGEMVTITLLDKNLSTVYTAEVPDTGTYNLVAPSQYPNGASVVPGQFKVRVSSKENSHRYADSGVIVIGTIPEATPVSSRCTTLNANVVNTEPLFTPRAGEDYPWPYRFTASWSKNYLNDTTACILVLDESGRVVFSKEEENNGATILSTNSASGLVVGNKYKVRVFSVRDQSRAFDSGFIGIMNPAAPIESEKYYRWGDYMNMSWISSRLGGPNDRVLVQIRDVNGEIVFEQNYPNTGSFVLQAPPKIGPNNIDFLGRYRFRVVAVLSPTPYFESAWFNVTTDAEIKVTAPVAGKEYKKGENVAVMWTSKSAGDRVVVSVIGADGSTYLNFPNVQNNGLYSFLVGADLPMGRYKVRVTSQDNPFLSHMSGVFSIVTDFIKITAPTNNSTLYANQVGLITNTVRWDTNFKTDTVKRTNINERVRISLWTGDGSAEVKNWTQANTGISNIPFTIDMKEGKYKIKIASINRPDVTAESYVFNITHNYYSADQAKAATVRGVGRINLLYPIGNEIVLHGKPFSTRATSIAPYEKFSTIKLIREDGVEVYSSIRSGVAGFRFTSMPSKINGYDLNGKFKIKIIPFSNPALAVESKLFTIAATAPVAPVVPTPVVPVTPAVVPAAPVSTYLVYPTNGSSINYGTEFNVKWNISDFGNKLVYLYVTDSSGYITYVTSPKLNTGSINFTANQFNGVPAVGTYKIRVGIAESPYTAKDKFNVNRTLYRSTKWKESSVTFVRPAPVAPAPVVAPVAPAPAAPTTAPARPSITVTVPPRVTPGYLSDGQLTVNWVATQVTGSLRIELLNSAGALITTLSTGRPVAPATFTVNIPAAIATGQYKVKITGVGATGMSAPFTITRPVFGTSYAPSASAARITLSSLSTSYRRSAILPVRWAATGLTGNVKIELIMAGRAPVYMGAMRVENGYYNYTIPSNTIVGTYTVKVTSVTNTSVSATSNAFRISY